MSRWGAPLCINICELSEIDGVYHLVSFEWRLALYSWNIDFCDRVIACIEHNDHVLTGTYDFYNSNTTFNPEHILIEGNTYSPTGTWNFADADVYGLDLGIFDCNDTADCIEGGDFSLAGEWIFNDATLEWLGVLWCDGLVQCVEDWEFTLEWVRDFSGADVSGMEASTWPQNFWCGDVSACLENGNFSLTGTYDFSLATVNWLFDCNIIRECVEQWIIVNEADPWFENADVTLPIPIENKGESLRSMGFFTSEGVSNLYNIDDPEELILHNILDNAVLDITDPNWIFFKDDGTKFYVLTEDFDNNSNSSIYEFTMSTAWDINSSNITYINKYKILPSSWTYSNIFFKDDGTRFYLTDRNEYDVFQYDLSTAWDITTATQNWTYDLRNVDSSAVTPDDVFIGNSWEKMYAIRWANGRIYEYTLSTPWDITTASYAGNEYITNQSLIWYNRYSIALSNAWTELYVFSGSDKNWTKHTLTTPRDLSTVSFSSSFYNYDNSFNNGMDAAVWWFYYRINEWEVYVVGKEDWWSIRPNMWKTDVWLNSNHTINYWHNIKEDYNAIRFKLIIHDEKDSAASDVRRFKRTGLVSEWYARKVDRTLSDWDNNTAFFCTYYWEDWPEIFNDRILHAVSEYEWADSNWYDLFLSFTIEDTASIGQQWEVTITLKPEAPNNWVTDAAQVFSIVVEPYYDVGFEAVNFQ